ncbi:MAG: ATP-dependent DNA ligase [Acidobacteria bacterium]|nr:ATP-dependent DNA ligase [Acidobacteriota bacterium]
MRFLASTAQAIAATTKKLQKLELLADHFRSRAPEEAAASALYLSGRVFPAWSEQTLQVGGRLLWDTVAQLSGANEATLRAAYRRHGDLGDAAADLLAQSAPTNSTLNLTEVAAALARIAALSGPAAKGAAVRDLLQRATAVEAKYVIKIITGDLRIGLKESLVEEALARAYGAPLADVQRANLLLGDVGETLRLAAGGRLHEARVRLFHPLGFMLASPLGSAEEALAGFAPAVAEDKYDGIRAQAHCGGSGGEVRIFSRTRDEVTESFPELFAPLAGFAEPVILDGEILAWHAGRALPFSELQKRLGRKKVDDELLRSVPVAYLVFDVLYAHGELVIDHPLRERAALLEELFAERRESRASPASLRKPEPQASLDFGPQAGDPERRTAEVLRAPTWSADSSAQVSEMFEQALERGNEGLMIKDPASSYTPGRRGRAWLKLKRELATLDVVVTAAEYGHGKRAGVLSDVTFAVRDGDRLRNLGKAYSGLTDAEISELTRWFLEHTIADEAWRRLVEPKIVLEVAFNAVMRSNRHDSGYALRFPRILRIRSDKPPAEIDTLERVREIFEGQKDSSTQRPQRSQRKEGV